MRTFNALHLASIEFLRKQRQKVPLASYDVRLLAVARKLGIPVMEPLARDDKRRVRRSHRSTRRARERTMIQCIGEAHVQPRRRKVGSYVAGGGP